jgi:hypothetical protein
MLGAGLAVAFAAGSASAGPTTDHGGQNTLQITKQSNEISQHATSSSKNKQEWVGFFNTPFALGSSDSNNGKVSQGNQSANSWAYNDNHSTQTNHSSEKSSTSGSNNNKDHNYKGNGNSGPCSCGQSGYGNQGKPGSYGGQNNSGSNEGQGQGQGSYEGSYQGQGQGQGTYEGNNQGGDNSYGSGSCSEHKSSEPADPPGQWTFQRNSVDQQACSSSTNEQKGVLHVNAPIAFGSSDSNNGKVSQGNQSANSGAGNNSWASQSNSSSEQSSSKGDDQGKYNDDSKDGKDSGNGSQATYQSNNVDQKAKSKSSNTQEGVVYWNTPVAIGSSDVNNGNVSQGNQSANSGAWNNNNSKQSNTSSEGSSSKGDNQGKYKDDSKDGNGSGNGSQVSGQRNGIEQSAQSSSSNEQKGVLYVNAPIAIGSSCSNNGNVSQGNQSANSGAGNNNQSTQSNGSQQSQQSQGGQLTWVNGNT